MSPSEMTRQGRRKFFGALGFSALALAAVVRRPFSLLQNRSGSVKRSSPAAPSFTANPMAVQRTKKGAAHHG
jgi:hypothetical protein